MDKRNLIETDDANTSDDGKLNVAYENSSHEDKTPIDADENTGDDANEEFIDNYSHMEEDVFYTTHNIPGPGVKDDEFYAQLSRQCSCTIPAQDILSANPSQYMCENYCTNPAQIVSCLTESPEMTCTTPSQELSCSHPSQDVYHVNSFKGNDLKEISQDNRKSLCCVDCPCNAGSNYSDGLLDLQHYRLPMYECNDLCACRKENTRSLSKITDRQNTLSCSNKYSCSNRVIQNGPQRNLKIFRHPMSAKGYGVKVSENLRSGEFICEYVGEVIDKVEAKRRYSFYKEEYENKCEGTCNFYIFHLKEIARNVRSFENVNTNKTEKRIDGNLLKDFVVDCSETKYDLNLSHIKLGASDKNILSCPKNVASAYLKQGKSSIGFEMFIDATKFGNIARYINHSCDPNCTVLPVRVDSIYPRLAIFARQDIGQGEELTYDYAGLDAVGEVDEKSDNLTEDQSNIERSNSKIVQNELGKVLNTKARNQNIVLAIAIESEDLGDNVNETMKELDTQTNTQNIVLPIEVDNNLTDNVDEAIKELHTQANSQNIVLPIEVDNNLAENVNEPMKELSTQANSQNLVLPMEVDNSSADNVNETVKRLNHIMHASKQSVAKPEGRSDYILTPCLCGADKCRQFLPFQPLN